MAYGRKKKAKKNKAEMAARAEGLVGCCFVVVGIDKKVAAEGDVQAKLRDDLYLVKYYGHDCAPHMEAVSADAFLVHPESPAWLFFEDEDGMDEWLDENTPNDDEPEGGKEDEPAPDAA